MSPLQWTQRPAHLQVGPVCQEKARGDSQPAFRAVYREALEEEETMQMFCFNNVCCYLNEKYLPQNTSHRYLLYLNTRSSAGGAVLKACGTFRKWNLIGGSERLGVGLMGSSRLLVPALVCLFLYYCPSIRLLLP